MDIASIIIFAVFIAWFKGKSERIADQAEADDITAGDYAIYVEGFDPKKTTKAELTKHFNQYGKVVEVQFAKNFKGTFYKFVKLSKLQHNYMLEDAKVK